MDDYPSDWAAGWTAFAGIMMVLGGVWWVISGIVGLVNDTFYAVGGDTSLSSVSHPGVGFM